MQRSSLTLDGLQLRPLPSHPRKRQQQVAAIFHLAGGEAGPHSSLNREEIDPNSVSGRSIEVTLATLDQLLDKYQIDAIDLLSIDTEGTELDILRGLDLSQTSGCFDFGGGLATGSINTSPSRCK